MTEILDIKTTCPHCLLHEGGTLFSLLPDKTLIDILDYLLLDYDRYVPYRKRTRTTRHRFLLLRSVCKRWNLLMTSNEFIAHLTKALWPDPLLVVDDQRHNSRTIKTIINDCKRWGGKKKTLFYGPDGCLRARSRGRRPSWQLPPPEKDMQEVRLFYGPRSHYFSLFLEERKPAYLKRVGAKEPVRDFDWNDPYSYGSEEPPNKKRKAVFEDNHLPMIEEEESKD